MSSPADRSLNLAVAIATEDALDVRHFFIHQEMSSLFTINLTVRAENPDINFDAVVGRAASFEIRGGTDGGAAPRVWTGVCKHMEQVAVEERGLSTYELTIVPTLWLASQRRNYRMFQQMSEVKIARKLLSEWGIEVTAKLTETYKKRKYRVQYGESDYAFMCRMLADAGVSFFFEQEDGATKLVLADAPHAGEARGQKIPFNDAPTVANREHVTCVRVGKRVRPGRYTMRDHDYRKPPGYKLLATATGGGGVEANLERFHYTPGAFLVESDKGDATPNADDKGKHRTDEKEGEAIARKRLQAKQATAKSCSFETNVLDLAPGVVMSMLDHPRSDLAADKRWLIIESRMTGTNTGEWSHSCKALSADVPYRPAVSAAPKPKVSGIESATVVGPPGEEIHTDEFGRVRVHFHWDRESKMDDNSSCWIHVSQPWGGAGFGGVNLPRVGQEVLVDFLGGDPDRPVIVGRVYTNLQKVPYGLPGNKTQSGWKSESSPGGGGFNELRFEDKAGKEQVYIQAQKDLDKLVKHDESVTIGHDRSKSVGNDDSLTVGNNRSRMVGNNETVTIGNNQSLTVGANQSITLPAGNQTETITGNRTFTLTGNLTETITGNATLTQTGDQTETLTGNRTLTQTGNQTETLTGNRTLTQTGNLTETITGATTLTHTGAATVTRTGASSLTQTGDKSEILSGAESIVHLGAKTHLHAGSSTLLQLGSETEVRLGSETHLQAGNLAEMRLGNATFVQVGNREESITGTETLNSTGAMTIASSAALKINGATINVEAGGNVVIKGSIIKLNC